MKDDTVVSLRQPGTFSDDPLTDILRAGARQLLAQAIEAEVEGHIVAHAELTDAQGRRRVVRHGYLPEREIQTGLGAVRVKAPRVRDRDPEAPGGRIGFTSSILPRYLRRSKSMEELLPWLYLKGISSGDFGEALAALLGPDAPGLTASTISRLKALWWDEYEAWQQRDLSARRYVYFWADGIYFSPRMDHDKQCVLVIIAADALGNKDIVGLMDGYRESAQSWKELLLDLKRRGLERRPGTGYRRRRSRFLDGAPRGLRGNQGAALLGPQDRQRAQPDAQEPAGQSQGSPSLYLDGRDQGRSRQSV